MKNLRELFNYYRICPFCNSQNKQLSVYYSKFGPIKFTIYTNYISILLDNDVYDHVDHEYIINIDLDSNDVVFGEESFGVLSGGNYGFSLQCIGCTKLKCEIYGFYNNKKIELQMLSEHLTVEDSENKTTYSYVADYLLSRGRLIIENTESSKIDFPIMKFSELPLNEIEKLISKFNNIMILS